MQKILLSKLSHYPLIKTYLQDIALYLRGQKINFSVGQIPPGTTFQQSVWRACQNIPYGSTISYTQLAAKINCPSARAVGTALKNNPLPILIPCHRVIKTNGDYGEYALGKDVKQWLIGHEKRIILMQNY